MVGSFIHQPVISSVRPGWLHILVLAALAGLVVVWHLRRTKQANSDLSCQIGTDCGTVRTSRYAQLWGISLEDYGLVYYVTILTLASLLLLHPSAATTGAYWLLGLFVILAAGFSIYLIYLQWAKIGQWCGWCVVSASLCLVMFGVMAA